eukprot:Pgem_evm1s12824
MFSQLQVTFLILTTNFFLIANGHGLMSLIHKDVWPNSFPIWAEKAKNAAGPGDFRDTYMWKGDGLNGIYRDRAGFVRDFKNSAAKGNLKTMLSWKPKGDFYEKKVDYDKQRAPSEGIMWNWLQPDHYGPCQIWVTYEDKKEEMVFSDDDCTSRFNPAGQQDGKTRGGFVPTGDLTKKCSQKGCWLNFYWFVFGIGDGPAWDEVQYYHNAALLTGDHVGVPILAQEQDEMTNDMNQLKQLSENSGVVYKYYEFNYCNDGHNGNVEENHPNTPHVNCQRMCDARKDCVAYEFSKRHPAGDNFCQLSLNSSPNAQPPLPQDHDEPRMYQSYCAQKQKPITPPVSNSPKPNDDNDKNTPPINGDKSKAVKIYSNCNYVAGTGVELALGSYTEKQMKDLDVALKGLIVPANHVVILFQEDDFKGKYSVALSDVCYAEDVIAKGTIKSIVVSSTGL